MLRDRGSLFGFGRPGSRLIVLDSDGVEYLQRFERRYGLLYSLLGTF